MVGGLVSTLWTAEDDANARDTRNWSDHRPEAVPAVRSSLFLKKVAVLNQIVKGAILIWARQ